MVEILSMHFNMQLKIVFSLQADTLGLKKPKSVNQNNKINFLLMIKYKISKNLALTLKAF